MPQSQQLILYIQLYLSLVNKLALRWAAVHYNFPSRVHLWKYLMSQGRTIRLMSSLTISLGAVGRGCVGGGDQGNAPFVSIHTIHILGKHKES